MATPWQRLYFLPEPQGQGSLRPTFRPLSFAAGTATWSGRFSRSCWTGMPVVVGTLAVDVTFPATATASSLVFPLATGPTPGLVVGPGPLALVAPFVPYAGPASAT